MESGEMGSSAEILTRLELDLAYASEKIVNLNVLMMHVATRENDFEAFALKTDREFSDDGSLAKALEFDLLSGVLDSELRDLDGLMAGLRSELEGASELVSSSSPTEEEGDFGGIEEKLRDSELSFNQSMDQISEIRAQSETFQNALESWNNNKSSEDCDRVFNTNPNIKLPSAEQQRHVLRMLEKSLAREIDLEKKLAELRERHAEEEEDLKERLWASEREVFALEDENETSDISGRWYIADDDNNEVVSVKGLSDKALERIQMVEFVVDGSVALQTRLRPELEFESITSDLKEKAEILTESNTELNKEVGYLKSRVEEVEILLKQSDMKLQCEIASAEASQEKQSMLYSTIEDMENLIDNLKAKVVKCETRAESAEAKCMALSESNAELNEASTFLQGRLGALETSLQQAEEAKTSAAKDIRSHTKVVNKMVLQLAFERNRLRNQIYSLAAENKRLVQKLQDNNIDMSKTGSSTTLTYSEEIIKETSSISSKLVKDQESVDLGKTRATNIPGAETVRRIDAGVLSFKHVLAAILILLISVGAYYYFHLETCPF